MIKMKYRLFPEIFVKKIINIIRMSKDKETARRRLKQNLKLDDIEIDYILSYKLKYLMEQNLQNKLDYFINRLINIHDLTSSISYEQVIKILENNNISYKTYETNDYEYYLSKGYKCDCPVDDLIIIEISNPNHNKHIEIQIDKEMNCLIDLYFGSYWFEHYGCSTEKEFINLYIDTIKKIISDEITIVTYHSKENNKWYGDRCFYKDSNPNLDDTKEKEDYLERLYKRNLDKKTKVDVYSWSKYTQIN